MKFVLYKEYSEYGVYDSMEEMIDDLINYYGVYELKGWENKNTNEIDTIIDNWDFYYKTINI